MDIAGLTYLNQLVRRIKENERLHEKIRWKWKRCKSKWFSKAANSAFLRMNSEIIWSERRLWGNLVDRTLLRNARGIIHGTDDSMNSWWEQFISWQYRPLMREHVRQKSSYHVWIQSKSNENKNRLKCRERKNANVIAHAARCEFFTRENNAHGARKFKKTMQLDVSFNRIQKWHANHQAMQYQMLERCVNHFLTLF